MVEMQEEREGKKERREGGREGGRKGGREGRERGEEGEKEREGEENEQGRQEWKRGRWRTTYLVPNETVIPQKIFIPATHLGGRTRRKEKESE